jgi:hypothetical protein
VWDWLGDGVYFFQDAPMRAWEWARERYPSEPAVIEASIWLGNCMDLLDVPWMRVIAEAYELYQAQRAAAGQPPLSQDPMTGNHRLDRRVFNYVVTLLSQQGQEIKTVRAVFQEGSPVFERSALFDRSHVQIAVRDNTDIAAFWQIDEDGRIIP